MRKEVFRIIIANNESPYIVIQQYDECLIQNVIREMQINSVVTSETYYNDLESSMGS